jgi:hypothetical protein
MNHKIYQGKKLPFNFSFFHKALKALQYHQYQVRIQINVHMEFHRSVALQFLSNIP